MAASEHWKDVIGYEGAYQVSDQGQVRRVATGKSTHVGRVLRPQRDRAYLKVCLSRNGVVTIKKVHRLVLVAFVGPAMGRQGNHKNGDKHDNRLANLEWMTQEENMRHRITELGVSAAGEKHAASKLTNEQVHAIRVLYASGQYSQRELGVLFGVSNQQVCRIVLRQRWAHLP